MGAARQLFRDREDYMGAGRRQQACGLLDEATSYEASERRHGSRSETEAGPAALLVAYRIDSWQAMTICRSFLAARDIYQTYPSWH
jgi:hypothetical protein